MTCNGWHYKPHRDHPAEWYVTICDGHHQLQERLLCAHALKSYREMGLVVGTVIPVAKVMVVG